MLQSPLSPSPLCRTHTKRSSTPSNIAAVDATGTAALSATAVAHNTASSTHVATGTALSASSINPTGGSTTSWKNSFPARLASAPAPSLRCADPSSVRSNASPTKPCFKASATALKRLAQEERFIGPHWPGFPGILHTWGRQRQCPPPLPYIVPGGGLSKDTSQWLPSRAHFFVPVQALSPISRALFQEESPQAALLSHIDPQGWHMPWNVHSQANPHGHTACKYLPP